MLNVAIVRLVSVNVLGLGYSVTTITKISLNILIIIMTKVWLMLQVSAFNGINLLWEL